MSDGTQLDLEQWLAESTVERNFKARGTSSRAAAYAARYASGAFAKIRTALLYGDFTPDEIAERTGINLGRARWQGKGNRIAWNGGRMTPPDDPWSPLRGCVWAIPISIALWCVILLAAGLVKL